MNQYFNHLLILYITIQLLFADSSQYKIQSTIYIDENQIIQDIYIEKEMYNNIIYSKIAREKGKDSFFREINSFFVNGKLTSPTSIHYNSFPDRKNIQLVYIANNTIDKIQIDWQLLPKTFLPKNFTNQSNWTLSPFDFSSENILKEDIANIQNSKNNAENVHVILKSTHTTLRDHIISTENNQILWQQQGLREISLQKIKFTLQNYSIPISFFLILLALLVLFYVKNIWKVALISSFALCYYCNLLDYQVSLWRQKVPDVSTQDKKEIFLTLHRNIYNSFDYHDKYKIYDILSRSTSGKLLEQIYLEIFQSVVADAQKTFIIEKIDIANTQIINNTNVNFFDAKCQWRVSGWVIHMGHKHQRINEYEAVYTISNQDSFWKITDCKILKQVRLQNE